MAKTPKRKLIDSIRKQAKTSLAPEFRSSILALFTLIKQETIAAFVNDPVSKELAGGPDAESEYLIEGNLFTFLGIPWGTQPISDLVRFLEQTIEIKLPHQLTPSLDLRTVCYFPSESDFGDYVPFHVIDGAWNISWPLMIENGIPGLARFNPLQNLGRSSGGIQMPKDRLGVRGKWTGVSYISKYNNKFRRELGKPILT